MATNVKKPVSFGFDETATGYHDVPSVSKLLNRKKLEETTGYTRRLQHKLSAPKSNPSPARQPDAQKQAPEAAPAIAPVIPLVRHVKAKAAKTPPKPHAPLTSWEIDHLAQSTDPMGRALMLLHKKGVQDVLFLAIDVTAVPAQNSEKKIPTFRATASIGHPTREALWSGMHWDPTVVPQTWNAFLKFGWVELAPPGAHTNIASDRNVLRSALGAQADEFMWIVRVGPAEACRGILAIFSKSAVLAEIQAVLPLLSAPLASSGGARA